MIKRYLRLTVMGLSLLVMAAGCRAGQEAAVIDIILDRVDDAATVTVNGEQALIDVTSVSGIGGFEATLAEGAWPAEIVVRLRTRGLEQLFIRYGAFDIATGKSSNDSPDPALILSVEGENGQVQSAPPSADIYYPDIRVVNPSADNPKLPADDGYYEITLPPHFHRDEYPSFSLQWIDFYR